MTRAVIWDMDGVLVDTGKFHFRAWRRIFQEHGREITEGELLESFGIKSVDILKKVLGDMPLEELRALARRKEQYYREEIDGRVVPLPGAQVLLKALGQTGFRQALASSAPLVNIGLILETLGVRRCFDAIVSGDEVAEGKPNPEIFLEASRRVGVPPERCIVVEDAIAGVNAARAAGMRCLAVTNTNPREKLCAADMVVDSLEAVSPQLLDRLLEKDRAS
ncbi:MAG: HAD family phosphatase [Dehalococcoidia bacterium]|nr:HAD family phosphatase [Dehalococcoidia bacterium]